ncbi:MAG TPA: DUF4157 domain-containing protein, partial [Kofleriaceae bacterium]|nr:DUF4157 domain-containing protein [Kofleriaceae bacterium]
MGIGRDHRSGGSGGADSAAGARGASPGKSTLVGALPVQMRGEPDGDDASAVHDAAAHGTSGSATALPYLDTIQRAFGAHDVSGVKAHSDAAASAGSRAMGAEAFATGDHVAFDGAPSLHTAAHEAAHVVQQRAGVHLKGGVGESGDAHERHADAVADRVVAGENAQDLLDHYRSGGGGEGVQRAAVQRRVPPPAPAGGTPGPVDKLRDAAKAGSAADVSAAYQALSSAEKVVVAHDKALVTDMVRLLDPTAALAILRELALPRRTLLQVASGGKPTDKAFLVEVLRVAGLDNLTALAAGAGDVRAFAEFATHDVIDPIVNAPGVTAMAQLSLASGAAGQALLEAVYPGQIPIEFLTQLHADLGVARGGFQTTASFRKWLLSKPGALNNEIVKAKDGFAWARTVWSSPDAAVLVEWIGVYTAFWGVAIGDGLMVGGTAADGAALRGNKSVATAVVGAIAKVHAIADVVQVFGKLHFTLAEQVKALHDAKLLDAAALQAVLNAPGVSVIDQVALTHDNAAIALVQPLAAGQRADQVLAILAADHAAFCRAVGSKNTFSTWVTHDVAQLAATMKAVPDWGAWIDAFKKLNAWELLLKLAGDATLTADLRTGIIAKHAWNWLMKAVPHPVAAQAQVTAILDLYSDGTGIALADKYLTWTALYRTPLSRAGKDKTDTWHTGFLWNTKWEKKYFAVDPDDNAMNLFFHSFRQLPRAHIDTAKGVMMNAVYHIKSDPLIGGVTYWNDQVNPWTKVASPGLVGQNTSWYMGDNWIIMRATGTTPAGGGRTVGVPDTNRIGNISGVGSAVNTMGVDPLSGGAAQNMTMFQNHATHEVGHAVGARKLKHGTYNVSGDNWTKTYGNWAQNGSANGYATMCGWTAAMDTTNYTIGVAGGTTITLKGAQIKAFLTGIIGGDLGSQTGHALAKKFGSPAAALVSVAAHGVLGAHLLVQNVMQLASGGYASIPDVAYIIPAGIAPGQSTVHFFATRWDNKWVTYDAVCWHNKVSHYGVSSYKEMFAEMYVAKFSGAAMPPANNGMNPTDFFNALQNADPKELGLPAYGASKGAGSPGPGAAQGPDAGAGASAQPGARKEED